MITEKNLSNSVASQSFLRRFLQRWCKTSKTLFQAHLIWLWITIYTVQGVPSLYDIDTWSPRLPTKIDLQKKVVCITFKMFGYLSFINLFSKKLAGLKTNISKKLDFWWSNPPKGTSIGHFGARGMKSVRAVSVWRKKLWRSLRPLRFLRVPRLMRLHRYLRLRKSLISESSRSRSRSRSRTNNLMTNVT